MPRAWVVILATLRVGTGSQPATPAEAAEEPPPRPRATRWRLAQPIRSGCVTGDHPWAGGALGERHGRVVGGTTSDRRNRPVRYARAAPGSGSPGFGFSETALTASGLTGFGLAACALTGSGLAAGAACSAFAGSGAGAGSASCSRR